MKMQNAANKVAQGVFSVPVEFVSGEQVNCHRTGEHCRKGSKPPVWG